MTLKETITKANDRPIEKLHIPEWGCDVWIRAMSGAQRDIYEFEWGKGRENGAPFDEARSLMCALVLVDEVGQPIFDTVGEGRLVLKDKSATALNRIWQAASEQNLMGRDAVKDTVKNSSGDQPAN